MFLYVTAGKGHQVPAEALRNAMLKLGHEAVSYDMFEMLNLPKIKKLVEKSWQNMLHFPPGERVGDRLVDTKMNSKLMAAITKNYPVMKKAFLAAMEKEKPDFILGTHYFISPIIVSLVQECGISVPVFGYAPDIFFYPNIGISKKLDKLYVPSELGIDWCVRMGFSTDQLAICPFPLKQSIEDYPSLSKEEARKKLELSVDSYTILVNLGGEGIGNTRLVTLLAREKVPCQVVVVGKMSPDTEKRYLNFRSKHPFFHLFTPGFVNNMNDYICACDVQIGKAGANSLMESLYLHRPFIITEQLYASERTELFFKQHHVGEVENLLEKQVKLLERYRTDMELQADVAEAFTCLPLSFGSKKFISQILSDTEKWDAAHR